MKNKKIKIILIIVLILMLLVGVYFVITKNAKNNISASNDENNLNAEIQNSEVTNKPSKVDIKGVKKVGDIEISNIRIELVEKGKCELLADVRNTSDEFQEATNLRIKVIDENGKVDEVFGGVITELAAKEPNKFKAIALADITDAVDIEFEVIEE